ncbi:MAG: SapC family protein [Rubrivivax sp.]
MINQLLHQQPVVVDRNDHRSLRMRVPVSDWTVAARLNAVFVAGAEFGDAARDFPLVFVKVGQADDDGGDDIAPIAVLGMVQNDNLFVENKAWRAQYMPAVLSMYPFAIGRLDAERFAICFDASWVGLSGTEGEPLFNAAGEHTEFMQGVQKQLETLESQIQRTRLMCRRLNELGLFREMRFDATMPDGSKLAVDGFLTVDDKKLNEIDDAVAVELHRSGLLGLVHAHYVSLGNMRKLLDWHVARKAGASA